MTELEKAKQEPVRLREALYAWHMMLGYLWNDGASRNIATAHYQIALGLGVELDERSRAMLADMGVEL